MPELKSFDGVRLHYEEEGTGAPVVLLHGLSSSTKGNWQDPGIWARLVEPDRRVIGLDARGHGRSEKPHDPAAYEGDAMANDVGALVEHLALDGFDLVGYSMGAGTALRFALTDHQIRRLVLGGIGGDPRSWGEPGGRRATMAKRWLVGLEAPDPEAIEDPVARRARKVFSARRNDLEAMVALLRANRVGLSGDLPFEKLTVPTLVVCGDRDASPCELADALPDGTPLVLEGDHEGVVVNPELAEAIAAFL
jgi:pimeloyl-ACP methyl ester carboxylesterase